MGVGRDFGMMGAPMLALLGLGLGRYVKAFMDGLHKGQREFAKQHRGHAKRHAKDLDQRTQEMLDQYRAAFAESSDPNDQQNLEQKIREIAQSYNDQKMINSLDNNGIPGVIQMLNWIDAKHGDLQAANRADDEHVARLAAQNPFMQNPVDDLGMPVTREPPPFETRPMRLAGPLPIPDTEDVPDPDDPDTAEGQAKEEAQQATPRPGPDPNLDRDPGPVTREEQNDPAGAGAPFQHLPFDPTRPPESKPDPYDPQRRALPPGTADKPRPIPGAKDPALTYPPGTRTLAQPIQTAQADTGTATDAPSPAETVAEDQEPLAGDPFTHAMTRAGLKAAGALPGYGVRSEDPAVAAEAKKQQALREKEKQVAAAEEQALAAEMTPELARIKQEKPDADLRMINGLAKRKFLGQISASELKDLSKRGLADFVDRRELELERSVEDIIGRARSGQLPPDQVMNEITKQLGPRMAEEVQSLLDGLGSSRANLKMAPYDKLIPLAKAVDPNLTDASLKARISTMTYWAGRTGTQIIARGVHAMEVGQDLEHTLANQPPFWKIKAWEKMRQLGGDYGARLASERFPEVSQWMADLEAGSRTLSSEANYVFAAGNPTMAERELMKRSFDWADPENSVKLARDYQKYMEWRMQDNRRLFLAGMGSAPNASAIFDQMLGPIGKKWNAIPPATKSLDELERGETGGPNRSGGQVHDYKEYFK